MRAYRPQISTRPVAPEVLVPGRLCGLRTWPITVDGAGALRLGASDRLWRRDGESTWAQCIPAPFGAPRHPTGVAPPAGNCSCGLYALHPHAALSSKHLVAARPWPNAIGIVEAWGRVQLHREGFRAQYARPIQLVAVGVGGDTDFGRVIEDLAISHRAGVLEVANLDSLIAHCEAAGIGMTAGTVGGLLGNRAG